MNEDGDNPLVKVTYTFKDGCVLVLALATPVDQRVAMSELGRLAFKFGSNLDIGLYPEYPAKEKEEPHV